MGTKSCKQRVTPSVSEQGSWRISSTIPLSAGRPPRKDPGCFSCHYHHGSIISELITRCNMLLLIQMPEAPNSQGEQQATNMGSRRAACLLWFLLLPNAGCQGSSQQEKSLPFTDISFIWGRAWWRSLWALHYSPCFGSSIQCPNVEVRLCCHLDSAQECVHRFFICKTYLPLHFFQPKANTKGEIRTTSAMVF